MGGGGGGVVQVPELDNTGFADMQHALSSIPLSCVDEQTYTICVLSMICSKLILFCFPLKDIE